MSTSSSWPVTVTVCATFQLLGVKISNGLSTVAMPDAELVAVTVTSPAGCVFSTTV